MQTDFINPAPKGARTYELKNHLGNVLATVSDRKDYNGTNFSADITSSQDYYPFGIQMPGRTFSSNSYRYGFQGQEKDDELKGDGNSLAFKYRIHDPRLGRFLSVDPLAPKYPHNSPFAFSENRLIDAFELEGLEMVITETRMKGLAHNGQQIQKAYNKLPPRVKKGIEGATQIFGGGLGVVASATYIGASDGFGAPLGGAWAMSVSFSVFINGLRNLGNAIEGGDESQYSKYSTWCGPVAEEIGVREEYSELIDNFAGLSTGLFSPPTSTAEKMISVATTMQTTAETVVDVAEVASPETGSIESTNSNGDPNQSISQGN